MNILQDKNNQERFLIELAAQKLTPINASLELLPLCNMNCDMCYVRLSKEEMESKGRLRTVEEWLDIASQMQKAGVLFLLLTGGEPLLYPGFRELYRKLRKMGFILTLNTNVTLITEEWAQFFGQYKPRRINVTLYGTDDDTYRELCHYPGGYKKTINGIRLLKKYGVDVKMSVSVAKRNEPELEQFFALGKDLDVPVHADTYMQASKRERANEFDRNARMDPITAAKAFMRTLPMEMDEKEEWLTVRDTLQDIETFCPGEEEGKPMSCLAGKCSFTINWQGKMRPCVIMSQPEIDVFEVGLYNAWNYIVEETGKIRLSSKCSVCKLNSICENCAACALWESGSYDGVPEYMCEYTKEKYRLLKEKAKQYGEK